MKKFITLAAAAASLFTGAAEAREYDFSFVGYYSGLRIAEATGSLNWGDGRYKLDLKAKSDGIVDWFTVITHSTHSEGSFAKTPLAEKHYYLSTDGKTLRLRIPDMSAVWQMSIRYELKGVNGEPVKGEIQNTIHALGK